MSKFEISWQAIIDASLDGLFVLDADEKVQYANAAALTLLGLPAPNGASALEWLDELGDMSRHLLHKTIQERGQVRLYLPDAECKNLFFQVEALPGGTEGVLCHVRRDHPVDAAETLAHIVHELRLPMTSIMGYAKMMMTIGAESLNDMQRQFLETIDRNVKRLDSDLLSIHDMTRVDRGIVSLSPGSRAPAIAAEQVLKRLEALIEEKGHHVTLEIAEDLPNVKTDAERFKQILHILLDNAFKYTPAGSQISLRGHASNGMVQIDVVDNGPGLSEAEQGQLFKKFFRGEAELVREYSGLGLNLYIARGLAELQGGRLWYESAEGQGSTFSFTLPVWEE
jgi:signal transduction histidine kinase